MSDLKERIKGNVVFVHYQDSNLIYKCEDGFEFPVPIEDCGSARFLNQDRAMIFMKWIKKQMSIIKEGTI